MRIVHVSPADTSGGAARGAYGLHKALRAAKIDSLMLVQRKYSDDPSVLTKMGVRNLLMQGLRDRLDRVPLRLYNWDPAYWWTVGWLPFNITRAIDRLRPDIVQFHWAGRGAAPIATLAQLSRYPLVWTLRDMWPLTGGCHYTGDCERFLTGCGHCPQLGSESRVDLSSWQWRRKQRAWRDVSVTCVAPSTWLANHARSSPLLRGNDVCVIPNGVDIARFKPIDRAVARSAWDLPVDGHVILFGAINSTRDPRKGFVYLAEALRRLAAEGWGERATVVVFGASSGSQPVLGLPTRYIGALQDDISLALLYSCADVMVAPSTQENAGKTAIEAMACGVPVVAFGNSGQVDIVDHMDTGYLAQDRSAEDLARGIAWCLEQSQTDNRLSRQARAKVVRCFDNRAIAEQYISLYTRCLARRQPAGSRERAPSVPPTVSRMMDVRSEQAIIRTEKEKESVS